MQIGQKLKIIQVLQYQAWMWVKLKRPAQIQTEDCGLPLTLWVGDIESQYFEYDERRENMPTVYVKKELYDEIVKKGGDVTSEVNKAISEYLKKGEKK